MKYTVTSSHNGMKHILITTGIFAPDIGGPASYARTLGIRLSAAGIGVTVLTYSSVRAFPGDQQLPFSVRRVWRSVPWGVRHVVFFVRAWMYARRADGILALNAVTAGSPSVLVARLTNKPLVVRVVGDYAWEMAIQSGRTFLLLDDFQKSPKSGRIARLHRTQVRTCMHAQAVIVPSRYLARMVAGWGIAVERIHIIPNGVDMPQLAVTKDEARRTLGIPGNIILSAGRLVPWKGFRMLIKLMPQLAQVNQFFRLVIVGEGPDTPQLRAAIRTLGLERKVFLVGRKSRDELALLYAAADMFVLNTGYEGFSHHLIEAMAAGVPVITTTAGGNPEVIIQGQNGFMVRYNDEFNLLEAIKALWKNTDLREQMIVEGKRTAAQYTADRMYHATMRLLAEIFENRD